jgi:transposase
MGKKKPVEIQDEVHEQVWERVCAIDVGKAAATVCVRVPTESDPPRRVSRVWDVECTTAEAFRLADYLRREGIQKVAVESTSDYWRIFYYVLEACGLDVDVVNARDVKNVPGRPKTDKIDAVWLAKLLEKGLLRPSFVPPGDVRELRDYSRLRVDLTHERTRHWQRLEKLLEDALIKVSVVASTLDTLSTRDMIDALIRGERNPNVLARLARGRMRSKHDALVQALDGRFDDHHGELARILLTQIDTLTAQIDQLTDRMQALIAAMPAAQAPAIDDPPATHTHPGEPGDASASTAPLPAVERLAEIPGVGPLQAATILAEVGFRMSQFPTANHLVSWAKLSPRTIQSAAKTKSGRTGKGNPYLKGALGQAVAAATRTSTFLAERYRRIVKRKGKLKAIVAVSRSILVIVWHLLHDPTARFHDLGPDFYDSRIDKNRKKRNHVRQLEALGYTVSLTPTN